MMKMAALCGASMKRLSESLKESAERGVAFSWTDEDITRLSKLVWRKKIAEFEKLKKASEPNLMEGSESKLKKGTDIEEGGSGMKPDIEEAVLLTRKKKLKKASGPMLKEVSESKLKKGTDIEEGGSGIKLDIGGAVSRDDDDMKVFTFREHWIMRWSKQCGSFESVTKIHPMPFTYHHAPQGAYPCDTLQIFSIKIAELLGGLKLPLDVFGIVTIRDSVDHKHNVVFIRSRDNCQTLTENDPFLALTGPTRAVVLDWDNKVFVEFELKVRMKVESADIYLSFLAAPVPALTGYMCIGSSCYTSKLSSLKLTFASITSSVEATIFIRAIEGTWPDRAHGQITALSPLIEHEKLVLLEFGADDVPASGDGHVELSRQVVSVSLYEELLVSYIASKDGIITEQNALFKPSTTGGSCSYLQLGTCKLKILVAWSVVSPEPDVTLQWC